MKNTIQPMLFKILVDGKPCHGGEGEYPAIGKWTARAKDDLSCCKNGYHLTADPLRWWLPKAQLFLAEADGLPCGDSTDKACFVRIRLQLEIKKDWPWLVMLPRVRAFLAASVRSIDTKCDISWANLSWANLSWANLLWANLSWANLSGANLSGANLSRADLSRANLLWADLSGANLSRANLSGANLSRADLSRADLSGADLSGADLSGADLSGAYRPANAPTGYKINAELRLEKL